MIDLTCFKAYDIRGEIGVNIDEDIAYGIGRPTAPHFKAKTVVIDDAVSVVVLPSNDDLNEKTKSNAAEVEARGASLIEVAADQLKPVKLPNLFEPFFQAMAVQVISYNAALAKGTDVDQSKNLANLVTVE